MKHNITIQRTIKRCEKNTYIPERSSFKTWVETGLSPLKHPVEVCLRIVDKQEMQSLNHTYRKKDKPTNVLSFPSEIPETLFTTQELHYLGDIILCADIINEEALEQNKTQKAHWAHMVLHGLLHLQGYDHLTDEEALIMETLEIKLLKKLKLANPYEEK